MPAGAVGAVTDSSTLDPDVLRAQRGDLDAFEAVYRAHYPRVYAIALRMLRDGREAEEQSMEVFTRVWESLASFRGDSAFSTWLHRLTVNHVLNYLRTERRRRARVMAAADLGSNQDPDGEQFELDSSPADMGAYLQEVSRAMPDTRIDLERAIAALPPRTREALILHHIEGYKYREVAELMGTQIGTVKAQIHRAYAMLREALEA